MRLCDSSLGVILYPTESKSPYYLPLQGREETAEIANEEIISLDSRKKLIRATLESEDIQKVSFCFQQVLQALMYHNIHGKLFPLLIWTLFSLFFVVHCNNTFDVQIASWVWNPELPSYSFCDLQEKFLQQPQVLKTGSRKSLEIEERGSTNISKATEDCIACLRLHRVLMHQLGLYELSESFESEMKVVPCMAKMEYVGIAFDANELSKHKELLLLRKQQLLLQAQQMLHRKVILSSPPDVATALYSDLRLPKPKQRSWQRKQSNADSEGENRNESYWEGCTKDSVLQSLCEHHEFPKLVLEYRKCKTLLSNWIESLPSKAIYDPITKNRTIFTHWSHTGTSTGRISSHHPNLQSLPKHSLHVVSTTNITTVIQRP